MPAFTTKHNSKTPFVHNHCRLSKSSYLFAETGGMGGGGIADLSREPDDEDDDEDGVILALTGGGGGSGADDTAAGRDSAKSTRLPEQII